MINPRLAGWLQLHEPRRWISGLFVALLLLTSCGRGAAWALRRFEDRLPQPVAAEVVGNDITVYEIAPQTTDPAIDDWLEPHVAMTVLTATKQAKLFVFLSGSFGKPQNQLLIQQQAARNGYHSIGLRYPNSWLVNDLCRPTRDPACFGAVRNEIIHGRDESSLVAISPANSIRNRLTKLLIYLLAQYPTEGWGQYLDAQQEVVWAKLVIGGHSQGGGHAAKLAQEFVVDRLCTFSSPADHFARLNGEVVLATWLSQPHLTPTAVYYGLVHQNEEAYTEITASWQALGMAQFGAATSVDNASPPYGGSHMLTTAVTPNEPGQEHGSTVVDRNTPLDANGAPLLQPAWQTMCFGAAIASTPPALVYLPLVATVSIGSQP